MKVLKSKRKKWGMWNLMQAKEKIESHGVGPAFYKWQVEKKDKCKFMCIYAPIYTNRFTGTHTHTFLIICLIVGINYFF